jgi:hypothetical protein
MLWIGNTSTKTGGRWEAKLLAVLGAAIAAYAREHRAELRALIVDEPHPESESADELPVPRLAPKTPGSEPPSGSGVDWKRYAWATVAVVIVAAVTVAGFALLGDDPSSNAGPGPGSATTSGPTFPLSSVPPSTFAGPRTIQDIPACSSLPRDSQWAKDLRSRKQVVVDGRCYPDPTLDVGAQTGPGRTYPAAAHLTTGQVLEDVCLKNGQPTRDMVGSSTSVWVRFKLDKSREAFVSAIWVQGEEGADPC